MLKSGTAALLLSLFVFAVFFANVALGAARQPVFLSDVVEMLMLLVASSAFVVGVLQKEAGSGR